jgi:hypothetical protein
MPEAHASFRQHERSLSWAQLAWHVATTPLYYVSEVFKLPTQSGWDLRNALVAVLGSKPLGLATTQPQGCTIKWK